MICKQNDESSAVDIKRRLVGVNTLRRAAGDELGRSNKDRN